MPTPLYDALKEYAQKNPARFHMPGHKGKPLPVPELAGLAATHLTKLAPTGGFLMAGNVTILVGVDAEKVQEVIDIIKEHSHSRKQMIPSTMERNYGYCPSVPVEVTVGGATIFVVDIERFERV